MRKSILAREYARKEADTWNDVNENYVANGEKPIGLEQMLMWAWKKGYESGQRAVKKREKVNGNKTSGSQ